MKPSVQIIKRSNPPELIKPDDFMVQVKSSLRLSLALPASLLLYSLVCV